MSKTITVRIDKEVHKKIKKLKIETGIPISRLIEDAVCYHLQEKRGSK